MHSAFSAAAASSDFCGLTTRPISTGRSPSSTVAPRAVRAAARICGVGVVGSLQQRRRWPPRSGDGRPVRSAPAAVFPSAFGKRAARSPSTSWPGISASTPIAVCAMLGVGLQRRLQERRNAGDVAQSLEHAEGRAPHLDRAALGGPQHDREAPSCRRGRPGPPTTGLAATAPHGPTRPPGHRSPPVPANSRATRNPTASRPLSSERSCSTSSGTPAVPRARMAPRVASRIRCGRTSALRTASYNFTASAEWPLARARSALRMQPSAAAERTPAGASAGACFQGLDGRLAADAAQGHGRGRSHLGVGVGQPGDEADRPPGRRAGRRAS